MRDISEISLEEEYPYFYSIFHFSKGLGLLMTRHRTETLTSVTGQIKRRNFRKDEDRVADLIT